MVSGVQPSVRMVSPIVDGEARLLLHCLFYAETLDPIAPAPNFVAKLPM